ncbi:hypothetical protein ACKTEK_10070 [Tepidamorphus sp. 3E244]|uniref:hypothetical protein n=1 Tax=Tepidamorphus sp. 3E244 TaxID=3385498 RepID=UPI0038FCD055
MCLSLAVWSVFPAKAHVPAVFDTVQQHAEIIAEHGHSHGFEEDLIWALHGHNHNVADHDHVQAFMPMTLEFQQPSQFSQSWNLGGVHGVNVDASNIERPPRA